jgi:hypothetical protein
MTREREERERERRDEERRGDGESELARRGDGG